MFGIGPWELAIILFIVLLIFGAGKLPQLGSSLGKGIKNFKSSLKGDESNPSANAEQDKKEKKE
jgi:sec-independent protein translocase protein TatA